MNFSRIVICLCLFLSTGALGKKSRVFGGSITSIVDFPHLVSIRLDYMNRVICGGSIISRWNILTAANCLYRFNNTYTTLKVFSGTGSLLSNFAQSHEIDYVIFHPEFINPSRDIIRNDIAIVKLRAPIYFNQMQSIIRLASRPPRTENVGLLAGWGTTPQTEGLINFTNMRMTAAIILDNLECLGYMSIRLLNSQFCTLLPDGIRIYSGDSGGSVTIDGELYGIISYSFLRSESAPVVHTQVYYYLDFILANTIQ